MNTKILAFKKITANENGVILADYKGSYTASFLAELPRSAIVDHIRVDGKFLEDVTAKRIEHHVALFEGDMKVAATIWFDDRELDLYEKLVSCEVQDFEVYYHLEYAHECCEISEV